MSIRITASAMAALVALAAFGCSSTVRYTPATENGTGIRYYQSSPYLLVYSNSKGGLKWQILYLPDQTKLMMAEPKVTGGRSEMTLYFKNGVLTGTNELGDTTELPKAALAMVQAAVPALMSALAARTEETQVQIPAPYLYKIVIEGDKVFFRGGQGDSPIIVPTLAQEAKP